VPFCFLSRSAKTDDEIGGACAALRLKQRPANLSFAQLVTQTKKHTSLKTPKNIGNKCRAFSATARKSGEQTPDLFPLRNLGHKKRRGPNFPTFFCSGLLRAIAMTAKTAG